MTEGIEDYDADRNAELEQEYSKLQEELREKLRLRIEDWEREHSEQDIAQKAHWEREKVRLLKQSES